jgi:hypothetical protein
MTIKAKSPVALEARRFDILSGERPSPAAAARIIRPAGDFTKQSNNQLLAAARDGRTPPMAGVTQIHFSARAAAIPCYFSSLGRCVPIRPPQLPQPEALCLGIEPGKLRFETTE